MTIIRKTLIEVIGTESYRIHDDKSHLKTGRKILKILEDNGGLRVFGVKQHSRYDCGLESFAMQLHDGMYKNGADDPGPEPQLEDFDDELDYYDAYDAWEEKYYDYQDAYYGDIDNPIPKDSAYERLIKIFHGKK
jgi:hypothetical protein